MIKDLGDSNPIRALNIITIVLCILMLGLTCLSASAQHVNYRENNGDWRYIGGDAGHTRSTPLNQITSENFENLEIEWSWSFFLFL